MKIIKIYFGKQQDSVLGNYADIITLQPVEDDVANGLIESLTSKDIEWYGIKTLKGMKIIRLPNVLWIDVDDVEEGDKNE